MLETYTCPAQELLRNSRIPIRVMADEAAMYEEIAQIMVDKILAAAGKRIVFICPVGPIAQYPVFVRKVNENGISLKNVWFFNMDEYLDGTDRMLEPSNSLSFRGIMDRLVYSRIHPDLVMPPEQRVFPIPGQERSVDRLLDELGGAECCLTGVGINGHIAFNEPPAADFPISDTEYAGLGTRCLDLAKETITNNGANKVHGALDIMPRRCISLGMRQVLAARQLKVYLYCKWQWGIMRKIALEPASRLAPASFLQNHPNSEMVITQELLDMTLN